MAHDDRLAKIAEYLREGKESPSVTVREFLRWFGVQRRGYWIVGWIRRSLEDAGLDTQPDFQSAYIDSPIRFLLAQTHADIENVEEIKPTITEGIDETPDQTLTSSVAYADPTYRISKLAAANNPPTFIAPNASIEEATTLMLANDFSQIPVMTNQRDVKGIVSWSSIGSRLALGKHGGEAREMMDHHQEIRAEASLFQAIPIIVQHQYVLVRAIDNSISGIVTASDLSLQFQQLSEPFLLLGEIENHVRRIIEDKFSTDELAEVRDPNDVDREVDGVKDLTFGEYIRLLENEERWKRVKLAVDRKVFCSELSKVRRIRNDVMHFDPDGIPPEDLERLRDFARFLHRLQTIGAS